MLAAGLAACAPRVQSFGPNTQEAVLTDDAVVTRDGKRLPLAVWQPAAPPRAVVVALHGFNMYRNYFADLGPWLADRGIATYAYDQRGFGGAPEAGIWGGDAAMAADLADVVALVKRRYPSVPVHLLGVSMGGAVSILALAADDPPDVDSVVFVAPAVWGGRTMHPAARFGVWLAAHTMPWNRATGQGLRRRPTDNIAVLRRLGRDPLVITSTRIDAVYGITGLMDRAFSAIPRVRTRALVLYGARDEIVPARPVREMLSALRAPHRLAVYDDGWHMLLHDLQAGRVWTDIVAWIDDSDAALPSGAERDAGAWQP